MSLPSYAVFYKGDREVHRAFINCGWFHDDETSLRMLKQLHSQNEIPDMLEWDRVKVYHEEFTAEQVDEMLEVYNG